MSKRFGRNQRRKAREQIAAAQAEIAKRFYENELLRRRLANAETAALRNFLQRREIFDKYMERAHSEFGAALGDKLKPYAKMLEQHAMNAVSSQSLSLRAGFGDVETVHVRVPALEFSFALFP